MRVQSCTKEIRDWVLAGTICTVLLGSPIVGTYLLLVIDLFIWRFVGGLLLALSSIIIFLLVVFIIFCGLAEKDSSPLSTRQQFELTLSVSPLGSSLGMCTATLTNQHMLAMALAGVLLAGIGINLFVHWLFTYRS